jgi:hypothetical protein
MNPFKPGDKVRVKPGRYRTGQIGTVYGTDLDVCTVMFTDSVRHMLYWARELEHEEGPSKGSTTTPP